MNIQTVFQQMLIIFMLILTGAVLYRRKLVSDDTSRQISGLVAHLCNPAHLIYSALSSQSKVSPQELLNGLLLILLAYGILLLCSFLLPYLLRVPKKEHFAYRLLTVYGNVGFIGIPLASAVLGPSSLIYVSLNNLVYNMLIYTHGISTIHAVTGQCPSGASCRKESRDQNGQKNSGSLSRLFLSAKKFTSLINIGTVSALLTLILYLGNFQLPLLLSETLHYMGRSTTFLSMLVLGTAVGQMPLRRIFSNLRLYPFTALRLILLPVLCIRLLRLLSGDMLLISTTALLLAVPAGNMPLILSRQRNADTETLSQGILLTTLLSLLTIPITALLLG